MAPTNGSSKRVVLGVAVTVIGSLTLFGLLSAGRITALEERLNNQNRWIEAVRTDVDTVRKENNAAHDRIMSEIKDQGKTQDTKFTEILKEIGRK